MIKIILNANDDDWKEFSKRYENYEQAKAERILINKSTNRKAIMAFPYGDKDDTKKLLRIEFDEEWRPTAVYQGDTPKS